MTTARRLIVIRHGETDWNAAHRIQGGVDVPLNFTGIEQARTVAPELAALNPTFIISSDLGRAASTVLPVAVLCGLPVHLDPRLREISVGTWEGLQPSEAQARYPDQYARWKRGEDVPRGGGETRSQTAQRVADALMEAVNRQDAGDTVLAASHGVSLRVGLDRLNEMGVVKLNGPAPHFRNTQWMVLELI